ncbi:MAG: hypothetical protein R3208_01520 [Ketobacteraceae bacterium]|nr:hypothetical protein [Ketobacteraceae bacterium]
MNDSYASPQSELINRPPGTGQSVEAAISGDYDFELSGVLSEGWQKTKGVKRYILGAILVMYVVLFAVFMVMGFLVAPTTTSPEPSAIGVLMQLVMQVVMMAITLPVMAGVFIVCLKQLRGQPVEFGDAFSQFGKTGKLILTSILMNIMIMIGMLLLIIPGIYLAIAYMMAIPLIVDRDMSPWDAMETSRKAITKHWFKFFLFMIVMSLVLALSMIPLGLGLIWTIPMMSLAFAVMYRDTFGIESV